MGTESFLHSRAFQGPRTAGAAAHATPAGDGLIEMRLRAIDQLFDPVDPSPFGQQDLSQWAADYIVESVKEMQAPVPSGLVISIEEPCDPDRASVIGKAAQTFFARQAKLRRRSLSRLLRRGFVTLAIGVTFLAAVFGLSRFIGWMLGDGPFATLLREGSLIVGWVAMWRPIEIFLYDWWPIVRERRLYEQLSRLDVRLVSPGQPISPADGGAGGPSGAAVSTMAAKAIARWENEGGSTNPRGSYLVGQQRESVPPETTITDGPARQA
jgi:hypothetical protein